MTLAGDLLFNLMLNAVASFWLGLAVVGLIWRFAKPSRVAASVLVLLLPLAKLVWDLRSGVPAGSFFWASEQGVLQRLGSFQIGVGVHPWGLALDAHLSALHAGGHSPQSFADVLSRALRFRVSRYVASVISFGVLAVSVFKLGKRALNLALFRKQSQSLLAAPADRIEWRAVGRRTVRVQTSGAYAGVPFAGGLFRPYVLIPAHLAARLSPSELEAVIEHELAHIRHFDLLLLLPLELSCALFWFLPGMKWLLMRQRRLLEARADDSAVAARIPRECVANALLLVAELCRANARVPVLAMSSEPSALRLRVQRLLEPEPRQPAQPKPWLSVGRALLLIWLVLGALQSAACGNGP